MSVSIHFSSPQGEPIMIANCPASITGTRNCLPKNIDSGDCFQAMWQNQRDGMYLVEIINHGEDFRFLACNNAMAAMSPLPVNTLKGKLVSKALPPIKALQYRQYYSRCIRAGHIVEAEDNFTQADENICWNLSINPVKNQLGDIYQLLVTATDITENRRAEETLQESRQVIQKVIDTVPLALFWKDRHSRYLGCNQSFLQQYSGHNYETRTPYSQRLW
ncbi:MAG: PAS domain-containing protein [Phormidesmis sp.]